MTGDLVTHLRRLGLTSEESRLYAHLLDAGPAAPADIADALGWTETRVQDLVARMTNAGLLGSSQLGAGAVAPINPEAALRLLVSRTEQRVRAAQVAALHAYDAFRRCETSSSTDGLVEIVTGAEIRARIEQLEGTAAQQVRRLDSPPYCMPQGYLNVIELDSLARGVTYRVVYAKASLEAAENYSSDIIPCIAAGESARVLPEVPVKLTIIDERLALVSLSIAESESNRAMLVVHPSSLLSALIGLFETTWRTAFPMHLAKTPPSQLRGVERQVLELLAAGLTDEKAAQLLSISRRTLTRHVERLMLRAGADTRFQLALYASRQHWI